MNLTILATTDFHGRFLPSMQGSTLSPHGSISQFCSLVRQVRATTPEVIVLDCGDLLRDSAQAYLLSRPEMLHLRAELLGLIGYDAFTPGNHDIIDEGTPSSIPRVLCNVRGHNCVPYTIIRRGKCTIAVIGVLTSEKSLLLDGTPVIQPETALRQTLALILKKERPDFIVGLFHAGRDETERLSATCPELDLIIYGHDHKPFVGQAPNGIPIINPGAYGNFAASITIKGGELTAQNISLSDYEANNEFLDILSAVPFGKMLRSPLATIPSSNSLTLLFHKILHQATGAPITAVPPLRVPSPIHLSLDMIYTLFPYDDYAAVSVRTGKELRESGLDLMFHDNGIPLSDNSIYRVGCDSFSLPPTESVSRESIQSLLACELYGKPDK